MNLAASLAVVAATVILLHPIPSFADDKAKAGELFKEGNALRHAGNYEDALEKYEAAYKLFPSYKIEFNVALTLGYMGKNVDAYRAYRSFLKKGQGRSPEKILLRARENLTRLKEAISLITIKCNVSGAVVEINDVDHGTTPLDDEIPLPPGSAKVSIKAPDYEAFARTMELAAGQVATVKAELKPLTLDLSGPAGDESADGTGETPASGARGKSSASLLVKEGNDLRRRKMYAAALAKYMAAYKQNPDYRTDYNIALTLESLDRIVEAANRFNRFLVRAERGEAERAVKSAKRRLKVLKMMTGRVALFCEQDGAAVFANGKRVGRTPLDHDIYLEPGAHQIEIKKPEHASVKKQVKVGAGQRVGLEVELVEDARAVARRDKQRKWSILAWSAIGLGGACIATAAALYGVGLSNGNRAHEAYRSSADWDEYYAHRQEVYDAERLLVAGHVMTGIAIAAGGAAAYFFLTRPGNSERHPQNLKAMGLTPMGSSGGGLFVSGSF